MPDVVARFLDRMDTLLARLDLQLEMAATPQEVAWTLCEFTGRELNLADCVVHLPEGDDLIQTAAWGPKRVAETMLASRRRLAIGRGVVGDCARQLRTLRVDDTRGDPRYLADEEWNLSELAVPIRHDGILLGVLDSENPEAGFYDPRYERALEAIAERGAARLWRLRDSRART